MIQIQPLAGMGEVAPGADIGAILADALTALGPQNGDILVVTQKIVSKAEGRRISLANVAPDERASEIAATTRKDPRLVMIALAESSDVVRAAPGVLITRHKLGLVMANAGIDASNIGTDEADQVLLLPEDPDASAARIRDAIRQALGIEIGVVISDSFGRPWRHGVVNVAIGAAGIPALIDKRGGLDRDGRPMQVTQIAYGDLLASAAGLAMGEAAEGIPAVLIRGVSLGEGDIPAAAMIRPPAEDLFR